MTLQDVNDGLIASKKDYKEILDSLHSLDITEDNVDDIIKFINICKSENDGSIDDQVRWFLLFILDHINDKNFIIVKKILLANKDIVFEIKKYTEEKKKEGKYDSVWDSGWTNFPLDEAKRKFEENNLNKNE